MYRRQFRGYLRKSKFSRLSKRYNAQPPAGIFPIYPIDDSDDLGYSVDIIIMTQSLTIRSYITFHGIFMARGYHSGEESLWSKK